MPLFLNQRDTESSELMDDPSCNQDDLFNTYRQFSTINAMISGWKHIYKKLIKPELNNKPGSHTLLDIGFGGGDIPIKLAAWAKSDGIELKITAIETDPRAFDFVQSLDTPANIHFRCVSSTDLVNSSEQFDIVISNHLLHHLGETEFMTLLSESKALSKKKVIFNDLVRSDWAYFFFNIFSRPVFRSSFITHDGLTSIKRSYTAQELRAKVPPNWKVQPFSPFRLLLYYCHDE